MGCCASKSNGVSPSDTPKKRPISGTSNSLGFREKQITVSAKVRADANNNNWAKKTNRSPRRPRPPVKRENFFAFSILLKPIAPVKLLERDF